MGIETLGGGEGGRVILVVARVFGEKRERERVVDHKDALRAPPH